MGIATINPATGETLKTFDPLSEAELDAKLQHAADTFRSYRRSSYAERAAYLLRAAETLEAAREVFGRIMTTEMGKPLQAACDEAAKCARACRYYAENGEQLLADETVATDATHSFIRYQPIGPVLAVMPWNFPFWQVFRFAAPALMAGNVGLLKHASNVPQCALAIEDIFLQAGFPEGVFQTLLIGSDQVGRVLDDPRVAAATLTGSEGAGSEVASRAGTQIKKTVLELGGSDPFVVMPSADLDAAVRTAINARAINNGQSCIAAKRFIVAEEIADEFEQRFVEGMAALKVGDPMDAETNIGPLATEGILDDLDQQVRKSVEAGARLLTGGERLQRPGNYYPPTVLADIPAGSPAYREETFGPVAALFRVPDVDDAIRLANDTTFGLGSSVWTNDPEERARFVDEIEAGQVFVNGMVVSDPRLPFGGVKRSGYGRELGAYGIREFVNVKTVWIKDDARPNEDTTE
ncbi:MAG: Succinate-semialdehyde dehydrogenase [NAD]; Succinate-semialdehyde dehydrogenase [NADP+] [uncultured Chloroflexia bacterium]|uniref:Succinate-semialdehyde dehydrogenase [NAD] Succinate-semialdehyde dehydrogenase [NADP+] n=1 Tax=uncultured Chloroflexia bacterium TaxID=1672391 RepID=A0A6J4JHT1_9CHLR|nr:MAG: Succinate-semialdehyde dehydrogenase [NAD]; Succinate-semialdehyde dehydrogenase [NADP+] [uncultured Chloroflexia bacterium]